MVFGSLESSAARSCGREEWYAPAEGVRLRYRDEGQGPAVLFIHGWTLDLDMWDPQVSALRDRFRCIRFDRRGFGLSGGAPALRRDVQDALALCRALDLTRFAAVGMSQGARIALQLALEAPALISCVVIDGPPELIATAQSSALATSEYPPGSTPKSMEAFREHWRRHPLMRLWNADQRNRPLLDRMIDRYPGHDLDQRAITEPLAIDERALRSLQTPVLIIGGEHDLPSRHAAADELTLALPAATRRRVRGAGHLPNLDNPRAYDELLSEFLERHCH